MVHPEFSIENFPFTPLATIPAAPTPFNVGELFIPFGKYINFDIKRYFLAVTPVLSTTHSEKLFSEINQCFAV